MNLHCIYPESVNRDTIFGAQNFLDSLLIRTNFSLKTRTALGWRGVHPATKTGNGWTTKIKGNPGVYGIYLHQVEESPNHYNVTYRLSYFPTPEEDTIELFAMETALLTGQPEYMDMVRDFLCYPEFTNSFYIADIEFILQKNKREAISLSLKAKKKIITISKEGIYQQNNECNICLVEPNGIDQNLPALHLAYPFFEILASTLTYNLSAPPAEMYYSEDMFLLEGKKSDHDRTEEIHLVYLNPTIAESVLSEYFIEKNTNLSYWGKSSGEHKSFNDAAWWTSHLSPSNANSNTTLKAIDRPQLIILSGFLGSGKTSFLKHFIEYHTLNNRFVAVIQNEIGEKGLDASVLEDNFGVIEMDEGCVCCSLAGELRKGIQQITSAYNPDIIILETTGLANPFNLLAEIEEVSDLVRFDSITTVVDALNFDQFMEESHIAEEQIKAADIILLNKLDLVDPLVLVEIKKKIDALNDTALILESIKGDINPALIYSADKEDVTLVAPDFCHGNHIHEDLGSIKVSVTSKPSRTTFLNFIDNLPKGIFRSKGRIAFSNEPGSFVFQYVNGRYELEESTNPDATERFIIFIGKNKILKKIDTSELS